MLERFKQIFSGLEIAYGQTKKTDDFSETGKHQTKSFTIKNPAAVDVNYFIVNFDTFF